MSLKKTSDPLSQPPLSMLDCPVLIKLIAKYVRGRGRAGGRDRVGEGGWGREREGVGEGTREKERKSGGKNMF